MILCIDSGNTRIKWAVHDGAGWGWHGALAQQEVAALPALLATLPKVTAIAAANVAGATAADAIRATGAALGIRPHFVAACAAAGGVSNAYAQPQQLGVDRWCALIGARVLSPRATLVVGLGTATTIDTLTADGVFAGGCILPGFELMRGALASGTAQLALHDGNWQAYPRRTADAIHSGCLEAQAGAIERAFARLAADGAADCLLFGGAAPLVAPLLAIPHRLCSDLVFEGLRRLADDSEATA